MTITMQLNEQFCLILSLDRLVMCITTCIDTMPKTELGIGRTTSRVMTLVVRGGGGGNNDSDTTLVGSMGLVLSGSGEDHSSSIRGLVC